MNTSICVGDQVKLISVPQWLIHDLPKDEQAEILAFVGGIATVTEIDSAGYYWIGFGATTNGEDEARFSGHTFSVLAENLEKQLTP